MNRRLDSIVSNISPIFTYKPDIVFTLETSAGHDAIPEIKGYKKFSDPDTHHLKFGGIALYVHKLLASHTFEISYNKCFISFRIDLVPHFLFIGTYIQPKSSPHFDPAMFCDISSQLIMSYERKLIPILGGDINCRYGNLNNYFSEHGLKYNKNVDVTSNNHGVTYGIDLCKAGCIFPLNHLI